MVGRAYAQISGWGCVCGRGRKEAMRVVRQRGESIERGEKEEEERRSRGREEGEESEEGYMLLLTGGRV